VSALEAGLTPRMPREESLRLDLARRARVRVVSGSGNSPELQNPEQQCATLLQAAWKGYSMRKVLKSRERKPALLPVELSDMLLDGLGADFVEGIVQEFSSTRWSATVYDLESRHVSFSWTSPSFPVRPGSTRLGYSDHGRNAPVLFPGLHAGHAVSIALVASKRMPRQDGTGEVVLFRTGLVYLDILPGRAIAGTETQHISVPASTRFRLTEMPDVTMNFKLHEKEHSFVGWLWLVTDRTTRDGAHQERRSSFGLVLSTLAVSSRRQQSGLARIGAALKSLFRRDRRVAPASSEAETPGTMPPAPPGVAPGAARAQPAGARACWAALFGTELWLFADDRQLAPLLVLDLLAAEARSFIFRGADADCHIELVPRAKTVPLYREVTRTFAAEAAAAQVFRLTAASKADAFALHLRMLAATRAHHSAHSSAQGRRPTLTCRR
jgi:hypothetical protein